MLKKKIAALTTSRADFDLLNPVLQILNKDKKINLKLIVSGSHFDKKFGYTYKDIIKSKLAVDFKYKTNLKKFTKSELILNLSKYIKDLSNYLEKKKLDAVIILGDRYETLMSAFIINFYNIPIFHISGGEVTEGSQDDSFRHAISKLSRIHFVSHKIYKKRLIQLGENKNNIFNYGSLGKENVCSVKLLKKKQLEKKLNITFNQINFLVTFHPETIDNNASVQNFKNLIESLLYFKNANIFVTSPNVDFGCKEILDFLNKIIIKKKNIFFIKSLGRINYFSLIHHSSLYIGNSSSGITEVPYIKRYSINLGNRQKGRMIPRNVITLPFDKKEIIKNIKKLIKKKFQNLKKIKINFTSQKIAKKISTINLNQNTPKKFIDLKNFIK